MLQRCDKVFALLAERFCWHVLSSVSERCFKTIVMEAVEVPSGSVSGCAGTGAVPFGCQEFAKWSPA